MNFADPILLAYVALQVGVGYATYRCMKAGLIQSKLSRAIAIFLIGSSSALSSMGPLGLVLGLPAIAMSSIIVSCLLDVKGEKQMRYRLYFKGKFQSEHDEFVDAEAQARWNYFEFQSKAWEDPVTPPGFMILSVSRFTHPKA